LAFGTDDVLQSASETAVPVRRDFRPLRAPDRALDRGIGTPACGF
jgi:hypothetical protein